MTSQRQLCMQVIFFMHGNNETNMQFHARDYLINTLHGRKFKLETFFHRFARTRIQIAFLLSLFTLSVRLSLSLSSVCLSLCLSPLSVCLSVCLSLSPLSVCLSDCFSLSVCLSLSLSLFCFIPSFLSFTFSFSTFHCFSHFFLYLKPMHINSSKVFEQNADNDIRNRAIRQQLQSVLKGETPTKHELQHSAKSMLCTFF